MVVLHPDRFDVVPLPRVLRGQVVRVQVVGDDGRGDVEQPAEMLDRRGERAQRLVIGQVAEVRRTHRPPPVREAHRVLLLGATGEHGPGEARLVPDRFRRVTPRAAHRQRAAGPWPHHRVVGAHVDRPVVGEERVGDAGQAREGVVVGEREGFVGDVAAGEHQRCGDGVQQQVVQRGVGQHQAEFPVAGRDGLGDGGGGGGVPTGVGAVLQQDDGGLPAGEQAFGEVVDVAQRAGGVQGGHHDGERLVRPVFAGAQCRGGLLVGGVGGEVVSADPLDRDDRPGTEQLGGVPDRVAAEVPPGRVDQPQPGPARGTAHRLRVEPPVGRVVVLGRARGAQCEPGHRGVRPVVGDVPHDAEPGAAVGAVEERVPVAPVGGVEQFGQTRRAGGRVGGDGGPAGTVPGTGHDPEPCPAADGVLGDRDPLDRGERGGVRLQRLEQPGHGLPRTLGGQEDPVGVVADVSAHPEPLGQRVHEGTEPDPLHDPLDPRLDPHGRPHGALTPWRRGRARRTHRGGCPDGHAPGR